MIVDFAKKEKNVVLLGLPLRDTELEPLRIKKKSPEGLLVVV